MKFLLLILVFTVSCTDNKHNSTTIKNTNTITQQTNISPEPPKPIELSYDKGLDLILIDTSFNDTLSRLLDNREEGLEYKAVYWNSNNNQYYTIENDIALLYPIPVTNTNFVYTINETKQFEPVFDPSLKEIFPDTQAPLLYIGSSSPLERVYLDPTNQQYYIKQLKFFDTSFYITYDNNDQAITNIINSPVYPYFNRDLFTDTRLTNTNSQLFSIIDEYNNKYFHLYYSSLFDDKI